MNDMRQMTSRGRAIEDGSFAIIDAELPNHTWPPDQWQVVRRVIHATADFEFQHLLDFHPQAIEAGTAALARGAPLVVDVQMIAAGLNRTRLDALGCSVHSHISDPEVIAIARKNESTRAIEAMRKAHQLGLLDGGIVAIGNAPTGLLEVVRMVREEGVRPAIILGVPVGFVSAEESKEAVRELDIPYIVARGRKGGSPIAVAIVHALLVLVADAKKEAP